MTTYIRSRPNISSMLPYCLDHLGAWGLDREKQRLALGLPPSFCVDSDLEALDEIDCPTIRKCSRNITFAIAYLHSYLGSYEAVTLFVNGVQDEHPFDGIRPIWIIEQEPNLVGTSRFLRKVDTWLAIAQAKEVPRELKH